MKTRPRKIFYMHIPKAGGTSLNSSLRKSLGDRFLPHCEQAIHRALGDATVSLAEVKAADGFSAHIRYPIFKRFFPPLDYFKFTVLRDPVEQTLSHLSWMRRIGYPENAHLPANNKPHVRSIARRLYETELDDFLATMNGAERAFFDNCQTRYFIIIPGDQSISASDWRQALAHFKEMDLVGLTGEMKQSVDLLCRRIGLVDAEFGHENASSAKYRIRESDLGPKGREILQEITKFDRQLCAIARKEFPGGAGLDRCNSPVHVWPASVDARTATPTGRQSVLRQHRHIQTDHCT